MRLKIPVLILTLALLASCGLPGKATPTATVPAPTSAPTFTATLPAEPLVILILPADMPRAEYDYNQKLIYDLAQAEGMRFQVRNTLTAADMQFEGPALKVVVAFPPDPGLADLAAAAPSVQFLAINIPGLTAGGNLSTIGATGVPVDQQAFLAGYITGLVAPEWKVGVLYQKDTPEGEAARNAFANGFTFYCGTCRNPLFPQPAGIYPVFVGIPTTEKPAAYPAYAELLSRNVVKAAYVFPAVATSEVLNDMAQRGMLLVGETMPGESVRPNWVASIQPDIIAAIQTIFPELVAGNGGQSVPTPLFLNDINPDLLSEGKVRLVQQVLDGLQNGTISTGVSP